MLKSFYDEASYFSKIYILVIIYNFLELIPRNANETLYLNINNLKKFRASFFFVMLLVTFPFNVWILAAKCANTTKWPPRWDINYCAVSTESARTLMRSYIETKRITCLCRWGKTIRAEQTATFVYAKRTFLERRITTRVLRTYISRQVYSTSLRIRGRRIQSADRFFRDTAVTKQIICNQFLNFGILDANLYHRISRTILIASYIMYYYILV